MLLDLRPWRNCFNNCTHRPSYTFARVLFHLTELSVFTARKFNALTIRITAMAGLSNQRHKARMLVHISPRALQHDSQIHLD